MIVCLTSRFFEKIEGGGGFKLNKLNKTNIIKCSEIFGKSEFFDTKFCRTLRGYLNIYIYYMFILSSKIFKIEEGEDVKQTIKLERPNLANY